MWHSSTRIDDYSLFGHIVTALTVYPLLCCRLAFVVHSLPVVHQLCGVTTHRIRGCYSLTPWSSLVASGARVGRWLEGPLFKHTTIGIAANDNRLLRTLGRYGASA